MFGYSWLAAVAMLDITFISIVIELILKSIILYASLGKHGLSVSNRLLGQLKWETYSYKRSPMMVNYKCKINSMFYRVTKSFK